ncbi:cholesterol 25-hydroxylase-like protein [Trichomycterus rosablanca]|uniref:cholesterol 25-hydroxylase-like protein n=1 Tax=Trichomycterus rosablanca TaxID=2290929 RepID=UPI002F357A52
MTDAFISLGGSEDPVLQPVWTWMFEHRRLRSVPLWSAFLAFSAHLVFSVPFLVLDLLSPRARWIQRYRLHAKPVSLSRWFRCLARIGCKYAAVVFPASACLHHARMRFVLLETQRAVPSLLVACLESFSCLLVFDTLFFVVHYTVHRYPWLYQMFHSSHHTNRETFALAAQDSSISELVGQQILASCCPLLVGCHPVSEVLFYILNIWLAAEDHCGYDFPWATHRLLPWFGGAPFHQAHHQHFNKNYAPYFKHWDLIFGTAVKTC